MASEQSVREIVEPHLALGEEPRTVHTDDETVTVVTDRRILRSREHEIEGTDTTDMESVMLTGPQILGARVRTYPATAPEWGKIALGSLFTGIGALFGYASLVQSFLGTPTESELALIIALGGLLLVPSGAYIAYDAFTTRESCILVEIISTGGETTLRLPLDATEIASAVSAVVGEG
ncbi:hypothetical protein BRD16_06670 [Halobacteriales archaeon SW_6_65_46]|nr:MAG: hypothetical protein BRD16_06670 [Halobacteriales archaeon SW_6_65_46]